MKLSGAFSAGMVPDGYACFRPPVKINSRKWLFSFLLCLAFGSLLPLPLLAQISQASEPAARRPGTITGSVVNAFGGQPVEGASVRILGTEISVRTDSGGQFSLKSVRPGTHVLVVACKELIPARIINVLVKPGLTTELQALELSALPRANGHQTTQEYVVDANQLYSAPLEQMKAIPAAENGETVVQSTAATDKDRIVELDRFIVSTTLGTYAEVRSSAGSKTPMDLKDLPFTLQILNASFIGDLRAQTLEDLYPYIIGMTRESTAALGFTLRGFSNNLTNTMLSNIQTDGLPGLPSRFGSPTTADVERVEVLKGPTSVLYGLMNPGGIINIVTKRPSLQPSTTLFTSVSTFAGENSSFGDQVSFTGTLDSTGPIDRAKHWMYRAIVNYEDLQGFRKYAFGHNHYFFPSLTYRWDPNTELTIQADVIRQVRFSDQFLVAPFNNTSFVARYDVVYQEPTDKEYDNGDVYGLNFQHRFDNQWMMKVALRDVLHQDGRKVFDNRDVSSVLPIENSQVIRRYRDQFNRRRYAYYDVNIYGDIGPETCKHTLLFGVNGGYETHDFIRWAFRSDVPGVNLYHPVLGVTPYPPDNGPTQDAVSKLYNYGAYLSDQIKIGNQWHASTGVRYDRQDASYADPIAQTRFSQSAHAVVPSAGLVYQLQKYASLYVSYAESFKPSVPQNTDANGKGFDPEKASQIEVGIKADFFENKLTASLSIYEITRKNVSEAIPAAMFPNGVQIYRLIGEQESEGVELSATYQPRPNWQIQTAYTYDDARTTRSLDPTVIGARNENAPRQSANFWTRYNVPSGPLRGFGSGLGVIFVGDRNGITSNDSTQSLHIASSTRVDIALYYQWKRYSFAVNVANALDRKYIASADANTDVVPGEPRKITASLKFSF